MARILVTGAAGFIGRSLCPALAARGHHVIAGLRAPTAADAVAGAGVEPRVLGDIAAGRDWGGELHGVDVVVHLAQRAHRRADDGVLANQPAAAAALAAAAAREGAGRFVYVSSIKAIGETTPRDRPFRPDDPPAPQDAYGRTKLATEAALARVEHKTGLKLVILRPPLVYGPGVGGNFRALLRLAGSGLPLPFAHVDNRRSFVFIENLVALIAIAAEHPAAAGRIWLASDGMDLSTPELLRLLAQGRGSAARLFAVPDRVFRLCRALPRVGPAFDRLTGSLQVDASATCAALGWRPEVALEEALLLTARASAARAKAHRLG